MRRRNPKFNIDKYYAGLESLSLRLAKWYKDPEYLASLLRADFFANRSSAYPPIRSKLTDKTYSLLADMVAGKRLNKGKGGRPKLNIEQRREATPVHDAAFCVGLLKQVLLAEFPNQTRREIGKRALYMAARRFRIDEPRLTTYLRRSRTDRRRLRPLVLG
jgi:hypothetical protein